jgi:hypothetical protein
MVADATSTAATGSAGEMPENSKDQQQPSHIRFDFASPDNYAIIELLWDKAPRTCAALVR